MTTMFSKTTKTIAATLAIVTALLTPAAFLGSNQVFAAAEQTKYIKEIRVYSGTHKDKDDAENWCKKQPENKDKDPDNDWAVFSDNLDKGADGALKKSVGVYLCYQTTTNPKEAIRDIAVMNENGNYSEGAYERILNEQREMYADLVCDTKAMIEEYRLNYQNGLPTAVQAHDFMNTYKEDDSGKLFGDFMLTVTDDDLTEVLLQANGQAVLMMQEQLAYACDTGKSTWLDRMQQLGSYETLRKQAYKACNNDARKADKLLKQKYSDTARMIAENWDDIHQHIEHVKELSEKYGVKEMSDAEYEAFLAQCKEEAEKKELGNEKYVFLLEQEVLSMLLAYTFDGATLYEYFDRTTEEVSGDNLNALYPLAACLSKGQLAGLNETVSLFSLLMNAQNATVTNLYQKGMALEVQNADEQTKREAEELRAENEKARDEWETIKPLSIYEGVDRGVFDGGVAVTSNAEIFGKSKGASWTDSFVESGGLMATSIGLGIGATLCAVGAYLCKRYLQPVATRVINMMDIHFMDVPHLFYEMSDKTRFIMNYYPIDRIISGKTGLENAFSQYYDLDTLKRLNAITSKDMKAAADEILQKGLEDKDVLQFVEGANKYRFVKGLEIGLAVAAIIIAVGDIVMTTIELYKYYNRDHLPIPKYMVDLSYNENKETSFIAYRGVLDQDGDQGDLNGGSGKQWLALYASYDEDAGDPILAPDGDLHKGVTQRGKSTTPDGYSPLHFFGKPNAPQNLTFADGDNGWSYNDDEGGTYFFFERGKLPQPTTD